MSPNIAVRCPNCRSRVDVPYVLLGTAITCPSCGEEVVPEVPVGTVYPDTGYEITYADFRQLLGSAIAQPVVGQLLSDWFGYMVSGDAEKVVVQTGDGVGVDTLQLHKEIQGDPRKQREIYGAAMALWR